MYVFHFESYHSVIFQCCVWNRNVGKKFAKLRYLCSFANEKLGTIAISRKNTVPVIYSYIERWYIYAVQLFFRKKKSNKGSTRSRWLKRILR